MEKIDEVGIEDHMTYQSDFERFGLNVTNIDKHEMWPQEAYHPWHNLSGERGGNMSTPCAVWWKGTPVLSWADTSFSCLGSTPSPDLGQDQGQD